MLRGLRDLCHDLVRDVDFECLHGFPSLQRYGGEHGCYRTRDPTTVRHRVSRSVQAGPAAPLTWTALAAHGLRLVQLKLLPLEVREPNGHAVFINHFNGDRSGWIVRLVFVAYRGNVEDLRRPHDRRGAIVCPIGRFQSDDPNALLPTQTRPSSFTPLLH